MYRTMGLLNLHEKAFSLGELTSMRPLAAVLFGGKYRIIDFALSNMVNSGIRDVGALVPEDSSSLLQHLRAGQEWDLDRKRGGLYILAPLAHQDHMQIPGDISYLRQHVDYLQESTQYDYVVLSASHMICNIDYAPVLKYHEESRADITLVYYEISADEQNSGKNVMLTLDENNWVTDVEIDSVCSGSHNRFMWIWIVKRELLIDLIHYAYSHGGGDFIRQLHDHIKKYKVNAYKFAGYVGNIVDMTNYYRTTMDLLKAEVRCNLFHSGNPIYTRAKDSQPTKYMQHADVKNSLFANNCRINGSVSNSVLSRSVVVSENSTIKNSILMTDTYIGENVHLENVICDKDVYIGDNHTLKGDKEYPLVIKKGTVI